MKEIEYIDIPVSDEDFYDKERLRKVDASIRGALNTPGADVINTLMRASSGSRRKAIQIVKITAEHYIDDKKLLMDEDLFSYLFDQITAVGCDGCEVEWPEE